MTESPVTGDFPGELNTGGINGEQALKAGICFCGSNQQISHANRVQRFCGRKLTDRVQQFTGIIKIQFQLVGQLAGDLHIAFNQFRSRRSRTQEHTCQTGNQRRQQGK